MGVTVMMSLTVIVLCVLTVQLDVEPEEVSNVRAEHPQWCVVKTESPPGQQDAGEIEGKEPLKVGGKR